MRSLEKIKEELLSLPTESRILLVATLVESLKLEPQNLSKTSINLRGSLFSSDKGKVILTDDFEAPLEEFSKYI
jgi:hypothetical protein